MEAGLGTNWDPSALLRPLVPWIIFAINVPWNHWREALRLVDATVEPVHLVPCSLKRTMKPCENMWKICKQLTRNQQAEIWTVKIPRPFRFHPPCSYKQKLFTQSIYHSHSKILVGEVLRILICHDVPSFLPTPTFCWPGQLSLVVTSSIIPVPSNV